MNNSKVMKFNKMLIAIITCIALVLVSVVGFTLLRLSDVAHADPTGNWTDENNYDTSWYVGHESDAEYTLSTPEQFAGLAYLVNNRNNFSGKTIILDADIDLDEHYWTPIGTAEHTFNGTFDGQEHTISHMTVNTRVQNSGLFGYVCGAKIRNVILASSCSVTSTTSYVGGIAGYAYNGSIKNVINKGTVIGGDSNSNMGRVGGIVGYADGTLFENVTNDGEVTGRFNDVGGIVGYIDRNVLITDANNSGTIKSDTEAVGGIVGYVLGSVSINCAVNIGMINGEVGSAGGIIGAVYGGSGGVLSVICNSYNNGNITATNTTAGGLVGSNNNGRLTIVNNYNKGEITGGSNSGGIVGRNAYETNIVNSYNAGAIIGVGNNGSIFGNNISTATVESVYYLEGISEVGNSSTYTGTATPMSDINMKGELNDTNSLVYKLNAYVDEHPTYTVATTEYELKLWNVTSNDYPTFVKPLTGITVTYNGGYIVKGEKIQGDKIVITATYSDDSTATVSADNKNVSYWVDGKRIQDPINHVFDEAATIDVTVKYGEKEAAMQLTVIPPIVNLTATYTGGEIAKGEKIQGDKLQFTVICEDESTLTIEADDENISYWVNGEEVEDPINHVFDEAGEVEVTVKYKGQETVMTLTVADDAPTPSASASATSTATATPSATATPTATATAETSDGGLSIGAIVGIIIFILVLIGVMVLLIYFDQVKKKQK